MRNTTTKTITVAVLMSGVIQGFCQDKADTTEKKKPTWESSAALGLTLTRGNSDTMLATVSVATGKKWERDEAILGADATYGKSKINGTETKTAESIHSFGQYNRLLNERLYGFGRLDILHDGVADINYRLTLSPGAGYYFIKEPRMDLCTEAGPGFIYENIGSGANATTTSYITLRVGEKFNYKISDHAHIWQTAEFLPQVDKFSNYIFNFELGIEAALTKKTSLRSFIQDSYDNEPAANRKKNDLKWVTALAYKF